MNNIKYILIALGLKISEYSFHIQNSLFPSAVLQLEHQLEHQPFFGPIRTFIFCTGKL